MFDNDNPFANMGQEPIGMQTGATSGTIPNGNLPSAPTGNTQNKYNILNMFWLVNPKVYNNNKGLLENEATFATIAYNIDFGNLRVEFGTLNNESIQGQLLCLNKVKKFTNGTIYPTSMFQLIMGEPEIIAYEQIINFTGADWQKNRPAVSFKKSDNGIVMFIGNSCYEFAGTHKEILMYTCKFALKEGLMLSGQEVLKK